MGRPPGSDDQDQLYLDNQISLGEDILDLVEQIKDICDEPDVLLLALKIEATALIIQKRTRDYRPRLMLIKEKIRQRRPPGSAACTRKNPPARAGLRKKA